MPRTRKVAPGQAYGEAGAQEEALAQVPLAKDPQAQALEAASAFTPDAQPLGAPGDPNQPFTAGLPMGPGPNAPPVPQPTGSGRFDAETAAKLLPAAQALATQQDLSPSTVMFLKMVRASLPIGYDFSSKFPSKGDSSGAV